MTDQLERVLAASVANFRLPRYRELPTVGLYLEQVTTYVNEALAPLEDVRLTSSMVANYVKHGLVERPEKKLYGPEQVADLIFITVAKNVLQLTDLRVALKIQGESYDLAVAYDYFCAELENMLAVVFGFRAAPQAIGHEHSEQKRMLRNLIVTVSHKVYLDKYFAQLK